MVTGGPGPPWVGQCHGRECCDQDTPLVHFQYSFREVVEVVVVKKAPKAYMQMVHVPQFISYTNDKLRRWEMSFFSGKAHHICQKGTEWLFYIWP